MSYKKDDELLEWNMTLEDNYEEEMVDISAIGDDESDDASSPTTKENWVRFSTEDGLNFTQSRREGDGISVDSQMYDDSQQHQEDDNDKETRNENKQHFQRRSSDHQTLSSMKTFLPTNGQSESARFQILDDEYDISPMGDVPPMEFRGSLKTDAAPYGNESSCCCRILRYFSVALVAFAIGILFGYFITVRKVSLNDVTVPGSDVTTRSVLGTLNATTASAIHTTTATTTSSIAGNAYFAMVPGSNDSQVL